MVSLRRRQVGTIKHRRAGSFPAHSCATCLIDLALATLALRPQVLRKIGGGERLPERAWIPRVWCAAAAAMRPIWPKH